MVGKGKIFDQKALQDLLREFRIKSGLRQIDVANALGFPQSVVSKYEVGERRLDLLEIKQLCDLFGISLLDFVKALESRLVKKNETNR